MDRETMERLLIDRRLGELPPDTHRLLEAYLQISPADAAAMDDINSTVDLAAEAIRPELPTPEELPPLSRIGSENRGTNGTVDQPPLSPVHLSPARRLALAASILLAFYLGTRWTRGPIASPVDRSSEIARVSPHTPAEGAEFWSVSRYASPRGDRARSQPAECPRIEWTSPLIWPHPGEKL